jgi:hypothetical protein
VSGDRPVEPKKQSLLLCEELILDGIVMVFLNFEEQIEELKDQGDIAAGELYNFIDHSKGDPIIEEYVTVIVRAVEEDPDLIYYEFASRVRKMTVDFFVRKAYARMVEELVEKLNSM